MIEKKVAQTNRLLGAGGLLLFLSVVIPTGLSSQTLEDLKADLRNLPPGSQRAGTKLPEQPLLDKEIDPGQYIVGPGDILFLNLLGELNYSYQIVISPEGTALIPSVGSVYVSGFTLKEAKEKIKAKVLTSYRGVDVFVTLIGLRQFSVSVVGEVGQPGTYPARASQRAVELIQMAKGITPTGSKRNIQVKRRDGEIIWVDLEKFQRAGDYKRNPYLQEGDIIFIPTQQKELGRVGIYGAIRSPGEFEFCPGDSLSDLLELGQGLRDDALSEEAELVRFDPKGKTSHTIPLNLVELLAANPGLHNLSLQPEDRVFIRFKPRPYLPGEATILGEIKSPGTYPIQDGKTSLTELVNLAGGLTTRASLPEAGLFRTSFPSLAESSFLKLAQASPNNLRPEEFEYLKSRQEGRAVRVSVDFVKLYEQNDQSQDRFLRDGDSIFVPPPSLVVKVAGQVVRSGLVPFSQGLSAGELVQRAGGFSGQADQRKIYVIKRGSGEWTRLGGKQKIEPGDTIWVPMKADKSFWATFKDIVLITGTLATTYFIIDQTTK